MKKNRLDEHISEIKPVSYIWRRLLEENKIPQNGTIVEVAPGYEKKIGDALAMLQFSGTIILIEPDKKAATHIHNLYKSILPLAKVKIVTKFLQNIKIGQDIPSYVDALVANHPFDDMALASAMHGKNAIFFSRERKGAMRVTPSIKKIYSNISDKDYIHGILATILAWKNFVQKLKPVLLIASQYPSKKLVIKGLTKRQNSGFIIVELLRDYYKNYLKQQYQDHSFGQQGDPAWWIVAKKPYVDLVDDLSKSPAATKRLAKAIFVLQKAKLLDPKNYDVVYVNDQYFKNAGYGDNIAEQIKNFAIILDNETATSADTINVYADRQKDSTDIGLSGNLGSGRAVYYGNKFNVMGVGKTTLCTSKKPSHSSGHMELIGSLRRVILSRWVSYFTKRAVEHPAVIALKETAKFKWNTNPINLALLVRIDNGALDRPSHIEYFPEIKIDFQKTLIEYAKLDAEYFAYRIMLGAWSNGNYSLNGKMIDVETASFVKYRGPYSTASVKYQQNFFGYEGLGFILVLKQLANIKGVQNLDIEKNFYEERRRHLSVCFLRLLGIEEASAHAFFLKHSDKVTALSDKFEKLSKKISPRRISLNLYNQVAGDEDPSLLDMSNLFRRLAKLRSSGSKKEEMALQILIRQSALDQIKPSAIYEPETRPNGEINQGEVFIKKHAVVNHNQLEEFLPEVKKFVHDLFQLLDMLKAEKYLPIKSQFHERLQIINQDFPTFHEINKKLTYWVEEYRLGTISPEILGAEIEKLCQLPYYPSGENFDFKNIPLLDYLKLTRRELKILSGHLKAINYKQEAIVARAGDNADSLFILIEGTCKIILNGQKISQINNRGALLGEADITKYGIKRTASVIAETPVRLFKIHRHDLKKIATAHPALSRLLVNLQKQRKAGIADIIRNLEIFNGINPEDVKLFLADEASEKRFKNGENLISQGEKTNGIYILIDGSVNLTQSAKSSPIESIELEDLPLTQGLFGERSVILNKEAVCSVTANTNTTALFISKKDFQKLLDRYPQLLRNCFDHISDYLQSNADRTSLISRLEQKLHSMV